MATDKRNVKDLFRAWRQGDAEAGGVMAQRFSDWYYAIATSRLGEKAAQEPIRAVSQRFAQGVVQITEARSLVEWAHGLLHEELAKSPVTKAPEDDKSQFTGKQRPKALLHKAQAALPKELELLEAAYHTSNTARTEQLAAAFGGYPLGVLKARYAVKKWLKDQENLPFQVAPEKPILDWGPLPLYEAQQMSSDEERVSFEQWVLSDVDLCRDIAEFAHFAIALRDGLGAAPAAAPPLPSQRPASAAPSEVSADGGSMNKAAIGGVAVVGLGLALVLLLLLVAVVAVFLL